MIRPSVRLPAGPLLAYADSQSDLARRLDVRLRVVQRWVHDGVPIHSADVAAVTLGSHPCDVWGADWWAACWAQDRREAEWAADREMRQWLRNRRRRQPDVYLAWRRQVREFDAIERWHRRREAAA